jgi:hypothetical protein
MLAAIYLSSDPRMQLKTRILEAHRVAAVEAILTRVDGEGMSVEAMPVVRHHARRAPRVDGEGMSVEAMPVVRHHARRATSE